MCAGSIGLWGENGWWYFGIIIAYRVGQEPGIFLATANYTTVNRLPVSQLFDGMTSIAYQCSSFISTNIVELPCGFSSHRQHITYLLNISLYESFSSPRRRATLAMQISFIAHFPLQPSQAPANTFEIRNDRSRIVRCSSEPSTRRLSVSEKSRAILFF